MARVFLTHSPEMLRNYYGERAIASLRARTEIHGWPDPPVIGSCFRGPLWSCSSPRTAPKAAPGDA